MNTILHIANDYAGSKVYKNLVSAIDSLGFKQIIYSPVKDKQLVGRNKVDLLNKESQIIYSKILNKHFDRILYKRKLSKIIVDLESKVDVSKIDLIHAHTWYSDGGVAFELSQKYNIPFIVAVRSTDISYFYKFFLFQRNFSKKILLNSKKIVFISESYKNSFEKTVSGVFKNKTEVIPNGIPNFWFENISSMKKDISGTVKVLYVGQFLKRKNIDLLIQSVIYLISKAYKIELSLVGDYTNSELYSKFSKFKFLKFLGPINDLTMLRDIYRESHIFAMPSVNETFGLVYIEALSQGLPILFTKDDGIDGFYSNAGEAVKKDVTFIKIADSLEKIINNYNDYSVDQERLKRNHNWMSVAKRYCDIYKLII